MRERGGRLGGSGHGDSWWDNERQPVLSRFPRPGAWRPCANIAGFPQFRIFDAQ
ncbi:hypothetical protein AZ19_4074 [Bordetella bronchiseptica E012]|uniref:Uncharacterized protein n=1 Tax=Bordetella bronchiseptica 00-P-2796 TaxID=1331199 RepID=A0ABR4RAK3_BORBO|nr:hypothetical protein L490_3840 [Bordetella bronchiseptica 00-P-2796]KDC00896.1 hypothetical protein AZ18_4184 [Bordetella bronchiseptica D993]KDC07595.1 hypothetical protein AZ19_4074 [Bordetella bronchiseptica E012]KDC10958.1 hypothetical protein AZ24_3973 [Bordetella bronchiseptica E013]KDD28936.1 hypothetical protein L525_4006 [Bordetella bronchiseptica MBORD782]KDD38563.1 hypothetical protein L527_4000 [Bordetella bronchiseptica MBORD839]